MQFKSILPVIAFGLLGSEVSAQTVSYPSGGIPASATAAIASKISAGFDSLATSFSAAQSSMPLSLANELYSFAATATGVVFLKQENLGDQEFISDLNAIITGTPDWLKDAPSDVQSYIKSIATAEASVINKAINAAPGSDKTVAAVFAVVAGVAVGAAVML